MNEVNKLLDRFNIYDVFSTMLPGMVLLCLGCLWIPSAQMQYLHQYGAGKYLIFFVLSYFIGSVLHEIGVLFDHLLIYTIKFQGNPRDIYLREDLYEKVLRNKANYIIAVEIENEILQNIETDLTDDLTDEEKHHLVFNYCMNYLEARGLTTKADKLGTLYEFSRAMACGIPLTFLSLYVISYKLEWTIPMTSHYLLLLCALCVPFFISKRIRYEQFRYVTILRTYYIVTHKNEKNGA